MVKVSCVLPVYNGLPHLEAAVLSVLAQSFRDFELLLINDGSIDGSADVCRNIAETDTRVRFVDHSNVGIVHSLNRGVELADGKYIARMDADDLCHPDRFARQISFLDDHPDVVAVGSRQRIIDAEGRVTHSTRGNRWHGGTAFPAGGITLCHPSVMFIREAFQQTGGYSEDFHAAEDFALWFEMARYGRICEMPDYLLDYRVHAGSTSRIKLAQQRESCLKAELVYQARMIDRDDDLAARFAAASGLDALLELLPSHATATLPSRPAIAAYFQSQVVKRLANRASISDTIRNLAVLGKLIISALPGVTRQQDRSTLRSTAAAFASTGWALVRRMRKALNTGKRRS